MKYNKTIILKDGRTCVLRNGTQDDKEKSLENFILTHRQTDWLLTYPDEINYTAEEQGEYLRKKEESENEAEILAFIGDRLVGTAGIESLGNQYKLRHRCDFGISVDEDFQGLGIGKALTKALIELAKQAGYSQMELQAVADNEVALRLYKSVGFVEYGRNPKGFKSRLTGYQELVLMSLALD